MDALFGLRSVPHSGQNFDSDGIRLLHFGQIASIVDFLAGLGGGCRIVLGAPVYTLTSGACFLEPAAEATPAITATTTPPTIRNEKISSKFSSSMKIPTSPSPPHLGQEVRKRVPGSRPVPPHRGHVLCCPKRPEVVETKVAEDTRKTKMKIKFFFILYSS